MPQTVTAKTQCTVTCALNDLTTVNFSGAAQMDLTLKNNGPGNIWISFDPAFPASIAGVNCYSLLKNETYKTIFLRNGMVLTMMADAASTVVSMIVLS